jgi:DNA-binding response OmpR family regulator
MTAHRDLLINAARDEIYRLLLLLMQNKGQILTRNQLLEEIWDASGEYVNDNTLSVYMKRLREKIEENPQKPRLLHTIRGIGYRMEDRAE